MMEPWTWAWAARVKRMNVGGRGLEVSRMFDVIRTTRLLEIGEIFVVGAGYGVLVCE
jgi:hypothetical protein